MQETLSDSRDNMRIFSFDKIREFTQMKVFQKYKVPFAVIGIGVFFVPVAVLGGFLAGLGTYAAMERLKDSKPQLYNWVLENPGLVELISIAATAGAFGLTLGGVLIGLVANFTMSATLDYMAEKDGLIDGVEKFSINALIKKIISYFTNGFKLIFRGNRDQDRHVYIPEVLPALPA